MLKNLRIDNYALIEKLNIDFSDGLSVITGETGAGKSIIIGALSLVLGNRADSRVILSDDKKCIVEALFDISGHDMKSFFQSLDLDYSDECIIRREVLPNGKSRAFINDTPVNLQQIKELASLMIDIHSQHENLLLSDSDFQLNVIDGIAAPNITEYRNIFKKYIEKKHLLKELQFNTEKFLSEKDYIQYQFNQLQEARLSAEEQSELEEELNSINHSKEISDSLSSTLELLDNEQLGIISQLKSSIYNIRKIDRYFAKSSDFARRMETSLIDIKDICAEIENILNSTEFSIERKNFIEERLNLIYSLQQKHRVKSIADLLEIQIDFEEKLNRIENFDEEINCLQKEINKIENTLKQKAENISAQRKSLKEKIVKQVEKMLADLGMPNGRFDIIFTTTDHFTDKGTDKVEFVFSANKNRPVQSISMVASGGEISRLMLIIKSMAITSKALPTIIFDEIDTGISGEIAKKMGEIMKKMGNNMQVIVITHLPQIASKGKKHYKVFKEERQNSSQTNLILLSQNERIEEIAEMIAGKNPSQAALDSAREMLLD